MGERCETIVTSHPGRDNSHVPNVGQDVGQVSHNVPLHKPWSEACGTMWDMWDMWDSGTPSDSVPYGGVNLIYYMDFFTHMGV